MATYTSSVAIQFPEDAGTPNTLTTTGTGGGDEIFVRANATNVHYDETATILDGADVEFLGRNATLSVGALANRQGAGFNLRDCIVQFVGDTTVSGNADNRLRGTNSFVNVEFNRDETENTAGDNRVLFGNFSAAVDAADENDVTTINGCSFTAIDRRFPIVILNIGFGTFNFQNTSLNGAVAIQAFRDFVSEGTTWANWGANDGGQNTYAGDQYFVRNIHQNVGDNNNVFSTNLNDRLPNIAANWFLGDDMSRGAAIGTAMQFNGGTAAMIINPICGGAEIATSFGGLHAVDRPSAAYVFVGWKPQWLDEVSGARIDDVRMSFGHISFDVEDANAGEPYVETLEGNRRAVNTILNQGSGANYRGHLLFTGKQAWNSTAVGNAAIPAPVNSVYRAKSFTHGLEVTTNTDIPTVAITNAAGNADTRLGSLTAGLHDFVDTTVARAQSLAPWLNGRISTTALLQNLNSFDDVYATVRRVWYDEDAWNMFALDNTAGGVDYRRAEVNFANAANTDASITGTALTVNFNTNTPTLTNGITNHDFDGVTANWNTVVPPSGMTIISGTHNQSWATDLDGVTFTSTPTINFAANADISGWITNGNAVLEATTPVTVTIRLSQEGVLTAGPSGNVTLNVQPGETIRLNVPNSFDGLLAVAYRENGLEGTGAWTIATDLTGGATPTVNGIYSFEAGSPGSIDINSIHAAFQGNNRAVVFTCGAGFRLTRQQIQVPAAEDGRVTDFFVVPTIDQNYANDIATIIAGLPTGLDRTGLLVEQDGNASTGTLEINFTGASPAPWDTITTTRVLAYARNDEDYLVELIQGDISRANEFIQINGAGASELRGTVLVESGDTQQQIIQGLTLGDGSEVTNISSFMISESGIDYTFPQVVIRPSAAGITEAQIRDAMDESATGVTVSGLTGNLQQLNDNVRVSSVKPAAVQDAQGSTADLPNN